MDDPRETDLFGNPVRRGRGKPGRPPKELTEMDLDMLESALMQGWTNLRTAKALGIGVSTLKRNFGPLLRMRDQMPDRLQLLIFASAVRKAARGDMGAVRQVRQMVHDNDVKMTAQRMREGMAKPTEEESSAQRLGKKAKAQKQAEEIAAGKSAWGDDLQPGFEH